MYISTYQRDYLVKHTSTTIPKNNFFPERILPHRFLPHCPPLDGIASIIHNQVSTFIENEIQKLNIIIKFKKPYSYYTSVNLFSAHCIGMLIYRCWLFVNRLALCAHQYQFWSFVIVMFSKTTFCYLDQFAFGDIPYWRDVLRWMGIPINYIDIFYPVVFIWTLYYLEHKHL